MAADSAQVFVELPAQVREHVHQRPLAGGILEETCRMFKKIKVEGWTDSLHVRASIDLSDKSL